MKDIRMDFSHVTSTELAIELAEQGKLEKIFLIHQSPRRETAELFIKAAGNLRAPFQSSVLRFFKSLTVFNL